MNAEVQNRLEQITDEDLKEVSDYILRTYEFAFIWDKLAGVVPCEELLREMDIYGYTAFQLNNLLKRAESLAKKQYSLNRIKSTIKLK